MHSRLALYVWLLSPLVAAQCQPCGPNEVYRVGSTCTDSCVTYRCKGPCPAIAMTGCFCKPGYYRNTETNKCVPADQCPFYPCPTPN
ncbi:hypothetical protein VHEMI04527 [[Torrubiella] hemipterigena]|uniref:TIL domain-containing protein n=1 Tax=[Torrubiella] hemipterigena TaxID=1531966 RepID=A0A0A1TGK2_9HYPO|nr:hypothetical protein VHEMI04527 [[Torrubiella] hemipterigena]